MGRDIHYCSCGDEIFDDMGRCRACEIEHANRLGDWENPCFDGPDPKDKRKPLENLNQENAGE